MTVGHLFLLRTVTIALPNYYDMTGGYYLRNNYVKDLSIVYNISKIQKRASKVAIPGGDNPTTSDLTTNTGIHRVQNYVYMPQKQQEGETAIKLMENKKNLHQALADLEATNREQAVLTAISMMSSNTMSGLVESSDSDSPSATFGLFKLNLDMIKRIDSSIGGDQTKLKTLNQDNYDSVKSNCRLALQAMRKNDGDWKTVDSFINFNRGGYGGFKSTVNGEMTCGNCNCEGYRDRIASMANTILQYPDILTNDIRMENPALPPVENADCMTTHSPGSSTGISGTNETLTVGGEHPKLSEILAKANSKGMIFVAGGENPITTDITTNTGIHNLTEYVVFNFDKQPDDIKTTLLANKKLVQQALDDIGVTIQERAVLTAIAMQETNKMSSTMYDASKDDWYNGGKGPATNYGLLNLNQDMINRVDPSLGIDQKRLDAMNYDNYDSFKTSLSAAVKAIRKTDEDSTKQGKWQYMDSFVNFHRGGYGGFKMVVNNKTECGSCYCQDYRNHIASISNFMMRFPSVYIDDVRLQSTKNLKYVNNWSCD